MASGAHDLDAHLQLRTDDRSLTGTLRVGPKVPAEHIDNEVFCVFLESRGVNRRKIDEEAMRAFVEEVRAGPGAEHAAIVVRGTEPRDGAKRNLEWSPQIARDIERINARKEALAEENDKGRQRRSSDDEEPTNFYEQSAFIIVDAGQVLATVSPPDPGEDGEDIFGNTVPAKKSPAPAEIDPETIELTNDNKLIALARGRLVYSGVDRRIERTLRITGDVGFETGNIDFPGPVEIEGGVRDRFVVRARGMITVRKLVEASTIESQRDIVLERGAACREAGRLIAGHTLRAGYLESADAECGQDCIVRHEITNCRVNARGMVKIPTGAIRGGTVIASRGVEASVLGSVQEPRTELLVGALDELEELIRQARTHIVETRSIIDPLVTRQKMLNSAKPGKLTAEQIESQMALDFEISEGHRRISALEEAIARLENNLRESISPVLRTGQCIHVGVVLWLPGCKATFRNELKGESTIKLDRRNKPVVDHRGETHPLSKFASVESDPRILSLPPLPGSQEADAADEQSKAA